MRIQYDRAKAGRVYRPMRDPFWKPVVRDGLLLHMPFRRGTTPQFSAAEATGLATETVDADGTRRRWEEDGFIEQALANTARITPDGVLVEGARTNLCLQSEDFATTWAASNATVTTNQAVAPDGQTAADKITDNGGGAAVYQDFAGGVLTNNLQYTFSLYVKEGTSPDFTLQLRDVTGGVDRARADFQWSGGVLSVKAEDVGTGTVEALSEGLYRASLTCPVNVIVGADLHRVFLLPTENGTGATGLFLYAWGAKFEAGAFASSYIPTTTGGVVRAADDLQIDNTGEAHIQAAAGTILIAATPQVDGGDLTAEAYLLEAYGGSGAQVILSVKTNGKYRAPLWNGSAVVCDLASATLSVKGVTNVVAVSWEDANYRLYVDGSEEDNDTTGDMASTVGTPIYIGRNAAGAKHAFSKMAHLLIYNRALPAGEILAQSAQIAAWVA